MAAFADSGPPEESCGVTAIASWTRIHADGVCWRVDPAYEALLRLGPSSAGNNPDGAATSTSLCLAGLLIDEWQRRGLAGIVKHSPHRTVYRVNLPGLSCYIKHNRVTGPRSWVRELVRGCKSVNECERLICIAARGVPTAQPIAVGQTGNGLMPGDSFLVTLALDDVETLRTVVEQRLPSLPEVARASLRFSLVEALAKLLGDMHNAGVRHHDLHAGNIMVRDRDGRPELFLIDLHAVKLGGPLSWKVSRDNLVLLHRWAVLRVSRADRLRFWKAYGRARRDGASDGKASPVFPWSVARLFAEDIEERTWQSNFQFWRRRDLRCRRSSRYFRRVRSKVAAGHAVTDFDPEIVKDLLADPDAPFRAPGVRLLKDSRSSTVAELKLKVNGVERSFIYKRFRMPHWHAPWTNWVRSAPVLRSWWAGHALLDRALPTPRPLLMLQRRQMAGFREGYLLTEKVDDAVGLHGFMGQLDGLLEAERRPVLRRYLDAVAHLIARLHRCQLSHRDLKADNILVSSPCADERRNSSPPKLPECWLIDLVGMKRWRRLAHHRRVQNLARLSASFHFNTQLSRTDRLRFLLTYLGLQPAGRDEWRTWWLDIAEATEQKVAHNKRLGRVLG
jgi:tRNA A-37 threonylcarbamoyl transferase component Bud32